MPFWKDMRVVIDATPLLVRSAGVQNYLYHWIEHLRRAAGPRNEIATFPAIPEFRALTHEASVARNVTANLYERHLRPLFLNGA